MHPGARQASEWLQGQSSKHKQLIASVSSEWFAANAVIRRRRSFVFRKICHFVFPQRISCDVLRERPLPADGCCFVISHTRTDRPTDTENIRVSVFPKVMANGTK
ncbi:Hypothetical predicted protein [Cloeon dipterum]|uniref:Uncharacterized protein n=1 Tax=Cloeon dipterum TaxID=197152 RepID=A0A8S1C7B3_9INSE|nr:Hypothetical predicted protein [Cloeon dipterum]